MSRPSPFGVVSFPHTHTPRAPSPGADERYSVSIIFDKAAQETEEFKEMKSEAMRVATEKWGAKAADMIKNGQLRMPFRPAEEKAKYAGYEAGKVFVNAWSKQAPDVIDGRLNDVAASDVFPGCVGRITYNPFAYDNSGNKGVSIGLNNLQISDFSTPRLDGKKKGHDDFGDALDVPDMPDSPQEGAGSGSVDDDLPF